MTGRIALALCLSLLLAACQSGGRSEPTLGSGSSGARLAYGDAMANSGDPRFAAIVVDGESGRTLHAENADALRYPASLTKMMTLYLLFGEVESGRLHLSSELPVSANAASQPPSKLGLRAGGTIRVEDAIKAMAVRSANDVAVVVAEALAGSEAAFAAEMTRTARGLGLARTTFRNASGLPDPGQTTTARDMARLGIALQQRYPRLSRYFAMREFSYDGRRRESTNELLGEVPGMDGIKTGYTRASGYNLVSSVRRGGRHIVAVVMGERSSASRNALSRALIEAELQPGRGLFAWR